MITVTLPWAPSELSNHAKGNGVWKKVSLTKKHRAWAKEAVKAEGVSEIRGTGDIRLIITFYPPDNRSDRVNMPARIKAQIDGIADALGVNDRRFHPVYLFAEPVKDARVVYQIDVPSPTDTLRNQLKASLLMEE